MQGDGSEFSEFRWQRGDRDGARGWEASSLDRILPASAPFLSLLANSHWLAGRTKAGHV